jgi:hypothetical protein
VDGLADRQVVSRSGALILLHVVTTHFICHLNLYQVGATSVVAHCLVLLTLRHRSHVVLFYFLLFIKDLRILVALASLRSWWPRKDSCILV